MGRVDRSGRGVWSCLEKEWIGLLLGCFVGLAAAGWGGAQTARPAAYLPGQIAVDPERPDRLVYLRDRDKNGRPDPAFLVGPGGPEGFLYGDFLPGVTQNGLLERLARFGGNVLYLTAIRSHGGDGSPTQNPFREHDPDRGVDLATLRSWQPWFQTMERSGVVAFFLLYDDSASPWGSAKKVPPPERAFVTELVRTFQENRLLIWIIAEEYQEALHPERVRELAALIRATDPHPHPIGVHQLPGTRFDFPDDPNLDLLAMQLGREVDSLEALYAACREAVRRAAGRYVVVLAELHPWHAELLAGQNREAVRQINWTAAMTGLSAVLHLGTWETGPNRGAPTPEMLRDYRRLAQFLESQPDLNQMEPTDDRIVAGNGYGMGRPGHWIVYLPNGGPLRFRVDRSEAPLNAAWYNPRTGAVLPVGRRAAGVHQFNPPGPGDWTLHLSAVR